ncbi:MAG: hypothetical protein DRQ88_10070 [Epsilonproteobacteria bacterium]|nr:MAG: hypothetical protein DRQ88_10070 [Campylobacterota bacterium]RLA65218.1 MAG: hypothetical protein DRQ89_01705 [Campylobacterota bacterium]
MFKYYVILSLAFFPMMGIGREYPFFKDIKTKIKDPFELRDPFKRKIFKRKAKTKKAYEMTADGSVFSNLPSIDNVPLNQIRVVGILLGKDRRAVAKISKGTTLGRETFILKEGMMLGIDKAELKAILPGGIVVVEKIKNVYDQSEYIETIIPVSAE